MLAHHHGKSGSKAGAHQPIGFSIHLFGFISEKVHAAIRMLLPRVESWGGSTVDEPGRATQRNLMAVCL
jgi:hypothetical protein